MRALYSALRTFRRVPPSPAAEAAGDGSAASPPPGSIMDMTPLFDEQTGRIQAIAPGCRAVTGIIESQPFVWSRELGIVRIPTPPTFYGMGLYLSDDGRTVTGFLRKREGESPRPATGRPGPAPVSSGGTAKRRTPCPGTGSSTWTGTVCRPTAASPWTRAWSPDGRCFFGRLAAEEDEKQFPHREFLACTGEGIEPLHWAPPSPK